jgi:hypothetical protein
MQGYGIFWAIVEDLYINENKIAEDYEGIAYDLRIEAETVKSIIQDFELFQIENGFIRSNAIGFRIEKRNLASKKGRESADRRWDDDRKETRIKANESIFYIIKVHNESEQFIKAGITTESISRRYSGKLNGYSYDVIYQYDIDVSNALNVENELIETFKRYTPLIKFPGYKECYHIDDANKIKDFAMQKLTFRNGDNNFRNANNGFRNAIKESKVKEIKVKENKVKENKENITANASHSAEIVNPFGSSGTRIWDAWKEYKRDEHRKSYKSAKTEQQAINQLYDLSGGNLETALKIVQQSIANQWQGLFELKTIKNANQQPVKSLRERVQEEFKRRYPDGQSQGS